MISFKALPIHPVNIMKIDGAGYSTKIPANFVEINPYHYSDVCSVNRAATLWRKENKKKDTFASSICNDMMSYYVKSEHKFYAITAQLEGLDKLKHEDIIGLAEVRPITDKMHELVLLQTRPRDKFASAQRNFTEVGRTLVESIIGLFPQKDLLVEPLCEARNFYFKLGFKSQILSRFLRHYAR